MEIFVEPEPTKAGRADYKVGTGATCVLGQRSSTLPPTDRPSCEMRMASWVGLVN
jgi:hypothetical protein